MGHNGSGKRMQKETDMFNNDERQQARRQRQAERLVNQRNQRAVTSALSQPATNADERRARRNAIDSLSREQIESTAGRLNANQYTLLNQEQQRWYTEATNARNNEEGSGFNPLQVRREENRPSRYVRATNTEQNTEAPQRRTLNQLYAQAYRRGGTPDAVNRRFQQLARENGYNNVIMTPNGPQEITRANPSNRGTAPRRMPVNRRARNS